MDNLTLKEFATHISDTIEHGGVVWYSDSKWFDDQVGLCTNLANYIAYNRTRPTNGLRELFKDLLHRHRKYDNTEYPFNGSSSDYFTENMSERMYKNQYRLDFIEVLKNGDC